MKIAASARKHGIADEDIRHAVMHERRSWPNAYPTGQFIIGPSRTGQPLEIVVKDADSDANEPTVIHAMRLRRGLYDQLR